MEKAESACEVEREIVEIIDELSDLTGLSFNTILTIIWECVLEERTGKPEAECIQTMGEKIGQSKKELANGSYN